MRQFHRPVWRPAEVIETLAGGGDPSERSALAQDSAAALLHRVQAAEEPEVVERLIAYADEHGIDDLAELWAGAPAATLPGALWRLYLLRHSVTERPSEAGYLFSRGLIEDGVERAIVGAPSAPTPDEVAELATTILRGAFTGDFGDALHRASAFARVLALGSDSLLEAANSTAQYAERRRGNWYRELADQLLTSARLWQEGQLH